MGVFIVPEVGAIDLIEDTLWTPTRVVIIEFPDSKSARAFVDSEEYAPVKSLRTEMLTVHYLF